MTLICMQDKDNIVLYANKHHIMSRDLKQWHSDLKMTFISACGLFRETGIPNNQCSSHCVNMTQKKTCFHLELLWLVVSLKTGSGKIKTGVDSKGQNTTTSVWMTHINFYSGQLEHVTDLTLSTSLWRDQVFLHIQIFNKIKFISRYLQKYMKNKHIALARLA